MASLVPDDDAEAFPEDDPEIAAYKALANSANSSADAMRGLGLAVLALVREQKKTNRLLAAQKNPPSMKAKEKK